MPASIIDSHIHLWPESAANSSGHAWMTPGLMLSKQHILPDYVAVASPSVSGVVYIETDRRLESTAGKSLKEWAAQPIEELIFLKSLIEGQGATTSESELLKGLVIWAPLNQGQAVFEEWLQLAEQTAGPKTWSQVKGFRFLLQAITDRSEFESLVFSDDFIAILKSFHTESRDFSFDAGVDMRSGGIWQLEAFTKVVQQVHAGMSDDDKTTFILNHMCKPDFTIGVEATIRDEEFLRWKSCMSQFASFSNVYMKLSGAFSELFSKGPLNTGTASDPIPGIAQCLDPWLNVIFEAFGPDRIMFGSDWPVCNVSGPAGEGSWSVWTAVVEHALNRRGMTEAQKERIWKGTACEAYRLDLGGKGL